MITNSSLEAMTKKMRSFEVLKDYAITQKGLLFVADSENHQIQVLNERYESLYTFGYKEPGQLYCPTDIAISGRDKVFVTDWSARSSCVNI